MQTSGTSPEPLYVALDIVNKRDAGMCAGLLPHVMLSQHV